MASAKRAISNNTNLYLRIKYETCSFVQNVFKY